MEPPSDPCELRRCPRTARKYWTDGRGRPWALCAPCYEALMDGMYAARDAGLPWPSRPT
jgi:hypothetical protein